MNCRSADGMMALTRQETKYFNLIHALRKQRLQREQQQQQNERAQQQLT